MNIKEQETHLILHEHDDDDDDNNDDDKHKFCKQILVMLYSASLLHGLRALCL